MERSWLAVLLVALASVCLCVSGAGLGKSTQSFGGNGKDRYQKWYEWVVKRQLGSNDQAFGHHPYDGGKFLDWGSLFNNGRDKRQLSNFPERFGNSQRFFTNGLQDWRSTFNGEKREAPEE